MMLSWLEWTFLLVVMFPAPLSVVTATTWATWKFSRRAARMSRLSQRAAVVAFAAISAIGIMTSFIAWGMGFHYIESPSGVPARIDKFMDVGWVTGVVGLASALALMTCSFTTAKIRGQHLRSSPIR